MRWLKKISWLTLICASSVATANAVEQNDLLGVYQQSVNSAPQYQRYDSQLQAQSLNSDIAFGALLPSIGLSATAQRNFIDNTTVTPGSLNYNSWTAGINLNQVVFDYSIYQSYKASQQEVLQAQQTYNQQIQTFILDVASAYFIVLAAQDQEAFAKARLDALKSTLDQIENMYKVGTKTNTDYQTALANYYTALAAYQMTQSQVVAAQSELERFTGVANEKIAPLKRDLSFTNPQPTNLQEWINMGMQNNPSIQGSKYAQGVAERIVSANYGSYMPSVGFQASYSANYDMNNPLASSLDPQVAGHFQQFYVGLSLSWNLFSGGSDYARIKQAAANYTQSQFATLDLERSTQQSITDNYYQVISLVEQIDALEQALIAAKYSYEQFQQKYDAGLATITEVLDQLQAYYESASNLSDAKYSYIIRVLQLKQQAGILSVKDLQVFNTWLV